MTTTPQTPWQRAAPTQKLSTALSAISWSAWQLFTDSCGVTPPETAKISRAEFEFLIDHAAHLEKDRDCWIANANELQKAFNKLEKENAELKAQVEKMRQVIRNIHARTFGGA